MYNEKPSSSTSWKNSLRERVEWSKGTCFATGIGIEIGWPYPPKNLVCDRNWNQNEWLPLLLFGSFKHKNENHKTGGQTDILSNAYYAFSSPPTLPNSRGKTKHILPFDPSLTNVLMDWIFAWPRSPLASHARNHIILQAEAKYRTTRKKEINKDLAHVG